ncbi:Ankyrin repeat-containing domain containing protein [Parasponia andersonii]|uniref:Ankyrin repeat-containing domain containing protein n=1 Tax=Parasponia andersonii TaxID=3476 RepID=A0A2P5AJC2_PARAD|nr:Ankyrin repeat-containing domain containing protein [Parasponia andersonii]
MSDQERKELLPEKKKVLSLLDSDGNSLLHAACKLCDLSLVGKPVQLRADISARNYEKLYPHQLFIDLCWQ